MNQVNSDQTNCHSSTVRIGYVDTNLSVYENASDILLEVRLLEGTIFPELGNIVVTVSTDDQTASGWPKDTYTFSVFVWFLHAHNPLLFQHV